MLIERHEIPLYDRELIILIGSEKEGDKYFRENTDNYDHRSEHHYACAVSCTLNETGAQTMFLQFIDEHLKSGKIDNGMIAHECLHTVDHVWTDLGCHHHSGHPEPSCYLIAYFVNLAHAAIKKYNDRNSTTASENNH